MRFETKNQIDNELYKLEQKEKQNSSYVKFIANRANTKVRPPGGRTYQHIRSRYLDSSSKGMKNYSKIINKAIKQSYYRPSSACSSPAKLNRDGSDSLSLTPKSNTNESSRITIRHQNQRRLKRDILKNFKAQNEFKLGRDNENRIS